MSKRSRPIVTRRQRKQVEAIIATLLDLLDTLDGDADFEEGGDDEPSLGSPVDHLACWGALGPYTSLRHRAPAGGPQTYHSGGSQEHWGECTPIVDGEEDAGEMPEAVNEDGGDIVDELHDALDEDSGVADWDAMLAEDFWPATAATQRDRHIANSIAMRALRRSEMDKPFTDPNSLPRHYALRCVGNCMEPKIKDGQNVVFDKEALIEPGANVVVWFKPNANPPIFPRVIVKRLVASDDHFLTVETLNPPARYSLDRRTIWAVHRHTHFM